MLSPTSSPPSRLDTPSALADALGHLAQGDPVIAGILARTGVPALRRRPGGFVGLCACVMGQQLSTASAAAITARFAERFGVGGPAAVAAASDDELRGCGLSGAKIRAVRTIAVAVQDEVLDLDTLSKMPADTAHAALCSLRGIGPWTADIYLLFCIGHADAFPAGDLALQEAYRSGWGLSTRPDARRLAAAAEAWRPLRGAAATLLWQLYRVERGREGAG
ncbi:MAG: DNA-3-methyladenine glycosylase family protein [Alsobacter sp.]